MERLYDITRQPPETDHERWFQRTYGKAIEAALTSLKTPTNPASPHASWLPFKQVGPAGCLHVESHKLCNVQFESVLLVKPVTESGPWVGCESTM